MKPQRIYKNCPVRLLIHLTGFLVMLWLMVLAGCANIVSPTGGPKDVTPPKVLTAVPPSGSVDFTGGSFTLRFDEFVQTTNLQQQILISPPLQKTPSLKLRGKSLTVSFRDTLLPNTTYSFQFGDAIRDITENNPMVNYAYYFSTGSVIDSMTLQGNVADAWDGKVEENLFVMLYESPFPDSAAARIKPRYVTRPDKSGNFRFDHLAKGEFHLLAISDLNNNMLYDLPTEPVAFASELIKPFPPAAGLADTLPDSLKALALVPPAGEVISLDMFVGEDSVQRVLTAKSDGKYKVEIAMRYPLKNARVEITDPVLKKLYGLQWNRNFDSLVIWLREHSLDTLPLILSNESFCDTLSVLLRQPPVSPRLKPKEPRVLISMNVAKGGKIHPSETPLILFDKPLAAFDTGGALLYGPVDTVPLQLAPRDTLLNREYAIQNPLEPGQNYRLMIPSLACLAWDGAINDTIDWAFGVDEAENFGTLKVLVSTDTIVEGDLLLLLLDDQMRILQVRKLTPGAQEIFAPLKPVKYMLKAVWDLNKNGRWDTGDYWKRIQPEKAYLMKTPVSIRANWEEEIEWNISIK